MATTSKVFVKQIKDDVDILLYKQPTQKMDLFGIIQPDDRESYFSIINLKLDKSGKKFTHQNLNTRACIKEKLLLTHRIFQYIRISVINDFPSVYLNLNIYRTKRFFSPKSLAEKIFNEIRVFDYYIMAPWYQRIMNYVKTHIHDVPKEKLPNMAELLNQFIKGQVSCIGKGWIHPEFYLIEGKQKESMKIRFLDDFISNSQKLVICYMKKFLEPTTEFYNNLALMISEVAQNKFLRGLYSCRTMENLFDMIDESITNKKKIKCLSDHEYIGITRVNQIQLKAALDAVLATQLHDIITELVYMHIEDNFKLQNMFAVIKERCVRVPKTTEELMALEKYMTYCSSTLMETMKFKCLLTLKNVAKISEFLILTPNHIKHISNTIKSYRSMHKAFKKFSQLFESTKSAMENRLHFTTEELNHALEQFGNEYLEGLNNFDYLEKMFFYSQYLTRNVRLMEAFDERVGFINKEESLFRIPSSTYPELDELKVIIFPFAKLVLTLNKWMRTRKMWLKGPFENLKLEEVEKTIEEYLKLITQFHKQYKATCKMQALDNYPKRFKGIVDDPDFNLWPSPLKLTYLGMDSIKQIKNHLQLIGIMCNPYLAESHWKEMSNITGYDITPNARTCLQNFIDYNIEGQLSLFEVISVGAVKEAALKESFEKMKAEWKDVDFEILKHECTEIHTLGSVDGIQALIDDHIIRTLTMRGSAFVKPFEVEVRQWYDLLKHVDKTIDAWCKVQKQWLHLIPIFSSEQIKIQMPVEDDIFHDINNLYSEIIAQVMIEPKVLSIAGYSRNTYEQFQNCLKKLDILNVGVSKYFELKRLVFPRFFFLSDTEILKILSETSNPLNVQPYLRKCFDGFNALEFDSNLNILKIISPQKESLPLIKSVSTSEANGSVELWFAELEQQMFESVKNQILLGYSDYSVLNRNSWLLKWPAQVVFCVSQINWTSECHACLHRREPKTFKALHICLQQQLRRTIKLLKFKLNPNNRTTLSTLIVLDIHAKDVVQSLFNQNIVDENDFLWLAQLRYYWLAYLIVQLTNSSIEYSYEYLGITERLVVTPLTERCFRTLIGAYNLHLKGAPEGPAGVGKTETIKDLSKALGIKCFVFNCSNGLNYRSIRKFLKGLATSGAWGCFDEFNRINIEVLSVVAQQMLCVAQAVKNRLDVFEFDGTALTLNPKCFICITMNPGYAGKTVLPDNLKILFRPVIMMVPDYTLIVETLLCSYGFSDSKTMSIKILTMYKLCFDVLSSQKQYDYGLRAIKSVLNSAAKFKIMQPKENESAIILRSLVDTNLPKLVSCDVPLFYGIISDLFPDLEKLQTDCHDLMNIAKEICASINLQPHHIFISKVIQMYQTMEFRHGLILTGDPFGGKTSCIKTLALTLEGMEKKGLQEHSVNYICMNPKSVTIEQLYGYLDTASQEWNDGIIANWFRKFALDVSPVHKWLIFDGPIDPVWVENINSVLDDNKKLCLNSGEVIPMTPVMSVIFEVLNLEQASPATVSRCGMIYFEPELLGWRPMAQSWCKKLPELWTKDNPERLMQIFDWLIDPALKLTNKLNHVVDGGAINHVWCCLKVIEFHLKEALAIQTDLSKTYISYVQAACLLGLIWGLGGSLDRSSMEIFDQFVKKLWEGKKTDQHNIPYLDPIEISIPIDGLLIDYFYNFQGKGGWKYYPDNIKSIKLDDKSNLQSLLVPTSESMRYMDMLEYHCKNQCPFLVTGPTGTGKSFFIRNLMMTKLPLLEHSPAFIAFTSSITARMTQDLILNELIKRRKGVYGAMPGKTVVLFIDDIGMPSKEKFGAQPPIELLRQYFDHSYWFDSKDTTKLMINDLFIVAAMGLPNGGRQHAYKRFLRHFALYSINAFSDDSMTRIFQTILTIGLRRNGFPTDIVSTVQQIVSATLILFKEVSAHLLPTPVKCHYVFNLRDFSRIINGHLLLKKESVDGKKVFVRLWCHEVLRVLYDRLIDRSDRAWFLDCMTKRIEIEFKEDVLSMLEGLSSDSENASINEESLRNLIFTSVLDKDGSEEERKYEEISSIEAFHAVCNAAAVDYNQRHESSIDIIIFRYALEHLSRLCRILTLSGGCGLLVGVSGCGRKSLVKLAAHICEQHCFQPEISSSYGIINWRADIKRLLKDAGGNGKPVVFLLGEEQIKHSSFLQDIDALLNSGEVPNLYTVEEKQEILDMSRLAAQGGNRNLDISPLAVFSFFINRCKQNLHIMICCSPLGSDFRTRIRLYPSLVNCCTIDWLEGWPEDALEMIAQQFLAEITIDELIKDKLVQAFKYFHISSGNLANKLNNDSGKKVYITSTCYLDMIRNYSKLISEKQHKLKESKIRYLSGLEKLEFAAEQVTVMQHDLELLQPQLKGSVEETQEMLNGVDKERIIVDIASAQVREDEKATNEQAESAVVLKIECENDLALAIPILEDATAALNTLKPTDITLVKSMKNPPDAVKLVMAAVCVMKDVKARKIPDPKNPGRKIHDYWGPSKRVLGDMGFLQSLKDYDKDDIPPHIIQVIRKRFIEHPDFRPQVVAKASSAAEGLCKWVLAMEKYDVVVKMVAPKKKKLAQAEKDFAKTKALLDSKRNELRELENKLADLNLKLETALAEKARLQHEVELCSNKLKKAQKIIGNLGGEKVRWLEQVEELQDQYDNLPGDILLSCGIMAYLAPFTKDYRNLQITDWKNICLDFQIPTSQNYTFIRNLGSEIKAHSWTMHELPADPFSIENAMIMATSSRWPLFIDPQGQANKWIKSLENLNQLSVIKFDDANYMETIENCIQYGKPVLLENVRENIDPCLDPVFRKSIIIQSGKTFIKLAQKLIPYNDNFRFYITTKLKNPHYSPEVFNKIVLINFLLTFESLSDKLLGIVVAKERPDLQEQRDQIIVQSATNRVALQETEDEILKVLSSVRGNILEDEEAVNSLDKSKALAIDIIQKQTSAMDTQEMIEQFRSQYKPVSDYSANLYYTTTELPNIDPMYQYSLSWFLNVYKMSIDLAGKSKVIDVRLTYLKESFLLHLYTNICRSLFNKDKTVYSFLVCTSIMLFYGELTKQELEFLLTGGTPLKNKTPNPCKDWLNDRSWDELCRLEQLPGFEEISNNFTQSTDWQEFYKMPEPGLKDFPERFKSIWNSDFAKLLVCRAVRPDRMISMMYTFVKYKIGPQYVSPPSFDLNESFKCSEFNTPLIFTLSPGEDPMQAIMAFTNKMEFTNKFKAMSLGQNQGPLAEELIKNAKQEGHWVCLQNCHLSISWMSILEKICEDLDLNNCSPYFRLWLTSYSTSLFPEAILQNGVKITHEAPIGLRANLLKMYNSEPINNPRFYESCQGKDAVFAKLLFGLSFFHAVVLERKRYGSFGWNNPYEFNEFDYFISIEQLKINIKQYNNIPYALISYLTGECNYGGRVSDKWDRRVLTTLLKKYMNKEVVFTLNYNLAPPNEIFRMPIKYGYSDFISYIKNLPKLECPEICGLHFNSEFYRRSNDFEVLSKCMFLVSDLDICKNTGEYQLNIIEGILSKLPPTFDIEDAINKYLNNHKVSMNVVLIHELKRYNELLKIIEMSLTQIRMAINGMTLMTPELEKTAKALSNSEVPAVWNSYSFPNMRPLGFYISDLLDRLSFFKKWYQNGAPVSFWLSAFFFPQAFLTSLLQNHARQAQAPIELLDFDFEIIDTCDDKHINGTLVHGLFLECARWDKQYLTEELPSVFWNRLPFLLIKPCTKSDIDIRGRFTCPVYRTSERKGTSSMTSQTSNYIFPILIETDPSYNIEHWILRGVALLCQIGNQLEHGAL